MIIVDYLERDSHVTAKFALSTITFIFTDTPFDTNASVDASLAWSLAIAALLTFAATLAAGLG